MLPSPITEIAPPAEKLDLDVSRDGGTDRTEAIPTPAAATNRLPLESRRWTAVRRREHGPAS
jgi:hypothetical protein